MSRQTKVKCGQNVEHNDDTITPEWKKYMESERENMDSVYISDMFMSFLCQLFGRRCCSIKRTHRDISWKRVVSRITDTIERSIRNNVNTDGLHKESLDYHVRNLRIACKSKKVIDITIIHSLTGIIFALLGGMPNYNDLRTLHYSQSLRQKVQTIIREWECNAKYLEMDKLRNIYLSKFRGNPEEFIKWYKKNYPDRYLKLF